MTRFKFLHNSNGRDTEHRFLIPTITTIYEKNRRCGWKSIVLGVTWWRWDCGIEFTWNLKDK